MMYCNDRTDYSRLSMSMWRGRGRLCRRVVPVGCYGAGEPSSASHGRSVTVAIMAQASFRACAWTVAA